jgi:hypothetical protein
MPILNLKKGKRVKDKIRLTTQRIRAYVFTSKGKTMAGFVFVGDMSETRISLYLDRNVRVGAEIQIAFEQEAAQAFKARMLVCNRFSMHQSFLGTPALDYRATIQFAFSSEFERQQFLKYYQELKDRFLFLSNLNAPAKKAA